MCTTANGTLLSTFYIFLVLVSCTLLLNYSPATLPYPAKLQFIDIFISSKCNLKLNYRKGVQWLMAEQFHVQNYQSSGSVTLSRGWKESFKSHLKSSLFSAAPRSDSSDKTVV